MADRNLKRGRRLIFCLVVYIICTAFMAETFSAAAAEPGKKVSTSELSVYPEFSPLTGVYYYDLFVNSIRIGKATIAVTRENDLYGLELKAKTRNAVHAVFNVRYRGEVQMEANPLQPITADIESESGEKRKEISIRFPQSNRMEITEKKLRGEVVRQKDYSLESQTFVLDPFSAIFLVRSLDWHVGMAEVFDIFTGKRQYELRLLCTGEETIEIEGVEREAWVIRPEIVTLTYPRETKLEEYSLYLSKDEQNDILMISGEQKIGNMVAKIRKFTRLPDN